MTDTAKKKHTTKGKKTRSGLEVTQYNAIRRQFNAHTIMQKCKMKSEKEKSPVQDAIFQKGM